MSVAVTVNSRSVERFQKILFFSDSLNLFCSMHNIILVFVFWKSERMIIYFKKMFALQYFLKNGSVFPILCNYAIFSLIMRSDAARGQLCEVAPAHNIRSPAKSFFTEGMVKSCF